jgi:glycosyltransferase involved in cell wall biosynthesis
MLADDRLASRVILRNQFVPDDVIDACCRIAVVAVFPYDRFAGQSGAATRAVSWGTPLVVSSTGALPSLAIDDDFVVRPGDSDALAQALERLLGDHVQPEDLRQRQLARITPFFWDQIAEQHATVYRELK